MISTLYDKYFQKSKVFLLPLLELPKNKIIDSIETYIAWENKIRQEDCKLICLIKKFTVEHANYEIQHVNSSPYLLERFIDKDDNVIYIFNLSDYKLDWNLFLRGKYSYLSENSKILIKRYYGALSNEFKYVDTFINPKKYTKIYSELLDVTEETLIEVGELCDMYDINKEFLKFTPINLETIPN